MESECWQHFCKVVAGLSWPRREAGYTSVNSVATIQIVPRSRSGPLLMPLLYMAFVSPLCLCLSFLLNCCKKKKKKTLFQPEVSIRFWHDVFMPRFVWPEENILPGASSVLLGSCAACRTSFSCCHEGTSFLIYPEPCLSLGKEMLACDCEGRVGRSED